MKIKEAMTSDPACCTPDAPLREVAGMFVDHDCGAIPVVNDLVDREPIGIVTDRDIACRAIAKGKNALDLTARDCMTSPCVTISEGETLDACCELMEEKRVRRVIVVDGRGRCCGIVSQADVARHASKGKAGEVVREVSEPKTPPNTSVSTAL